MTRKLAGWLWVLPALAFYGTFVLFPVAQTVQYSFYDWDGIGVATWAGLDNYARVFGNSELYGSIVNAFILILFFAIIPIVIGLMAAAVLREVRGRFGNAVARTVLFLPQIIPLAGAAIAWSWMYSTDGVVNQLLREFLAITVPGLRQEIVVALTVLVIAALASFDIIYVATLGGPGYSTMVPGLMIYRLTFTAQQVGVASALAVVLVVLVVAIVVPLQRLRREA